MVFAYCSVYSLDQAIFQETFNSRSRRILVTLYWDFTRLLHCCCNQGLCCCVEVHNQKLCCLSYTWLKNGKEYSVMCTRANETNTHLTSMIMLCSNHGPICWRHVRGDTTSDIPCTTPIPVFHFRSTLRFPSEAVMYSCLFISSWVPITKAASKRSVLHHAHSVYNFCLDKELRKWIQDAKHSIFYSWY